MPALLFVANLFGVSVFRLLVYAGLVLAIIVGALTIRQHYINKGYQAALVAVKKQDNIAIDAARKVEKKAAVCTETNGWWDVVSQSCKLEDAE
ncbi:hypothetical protein [Afipia carboxidovorans]|uniref:hypothetical protein n=1 Tax=Afipia carboxidovorans TaxID=40137 RepID=UPI00308E33E8|nr:hypothetical protein CRBSH125_09400 [Afipia carboxidovorans]